MFQILKNIAQAIFPAMSAENWVLVLLVLVVVLLFVNLIRR